MDQYADLYEHLALSRRDQVFDQSWAAWNRALTGVSFVCLPAVVDAAYALDEELWRADWAIRGGTTGQREWLERRRSVEAARAALILAVRRATSPRFRTQVRTSGRPADTDPMWTSRPPP